ncbi:ankyrin repeat-containing domain protein [Coprinopsis sp. MPI-PUGE-AT-0042]|nr:ankyrin repeat-containing domain protein [Coprinopsis sp. MPI-PUGE-AT-0042]
MRPDAWATHARESLDLEDTRRRVATLIGESVAFPTYTRPGIFDILSPLHILALYDLPISPLTHDDIGDTNVATTNLPTLPLIPAPWHGHEGAAVSLLSHPATAVNVVDSEGWSALILAGGYGREAIVKLLLARSDIQVNLLDTRGWSALRMAARHGQDDIVTLLLAHPEIQVNLVDSDGWSALMSAARSGHEGIAKALVARTEI